MRPTEVLGVWGGFSVSTEDGKMVDFDRITPGLLPGETSHFEGDYEITSLHTSTVRQHEPSWVVYLHMPLVGATDFFGKPQMVRRFVALFATDALAYEYVAIMTAIGQGLDPARLEGDRSPTEAAEETEDGLRDDGDGGAGNPGDELRTGALVHVEAPVEGQDDDGRGEG